jgi:trehalose synthase
MRALKYVELPALAPERFRELVGEEEFARFEARLERFRELSEGSVFYNVNSTAHGGGVAEMLHTMLPYARGAGVDARWLVVRGNPDFFAVTKRLHNNLHGVPGDGGELGEAEHEIYRHALGTAARQLTHILRPRDVVILHDPQTAGMAAAARQAGATVVWRCHVGLDDPNDLARRAWQFLERYVFDAHTWVFSRNSYAWTELDPQRVAVVRPSIDPFSPKNQELEPEAAVGILASTGVIDGGRTSPARYSRQDGSPARVDHPSEVVEDTRLAPDTPYALQVSRWDRLKDPIGVMEGFVERVLPHLPDMHLVLAGPAHGRVADDPEAVQVHDEVVQRRNALPDAARERIHLANLPMVRPEENAAIVNALQRRAAVVIQKSLVEGFGITVAEAMWKTRPIVASAIGGIRDQIVDGKSGLLVPDPSDLRAFGDALIRTLTDHRLANRLAKGAHERARHTFLHPRHLMDWGDLVERLWAPASAAGEI